MWLKFWLEPCFQRWVQLLVSAVTAWRFLERFSYEAPGSLNPRLCSPRHSSAAVPLIWFIQSAGLGFP